jgi:hypothetical protein
LFLEPRVHDFFQFLTLPHFTSLEKIFGGCEDDKLPASFHFAKSNRNFFLIRAHGGTGNASRSNWPCTGRPLFHFSQIGASVAAGIGG